MRVALIGSGVSAVGALLALRYVKDLELYHYVGMDSKDVGNWRYDNGQICSSLRTGGLSRFWHGVIPVTGQYSEDTDFQNLFSRFYGNIQSQYDLFIPFRPIRGDRLRKKLVSDLNLKKLTVDGVADLSRVGLRSIESGRGGLNGEFDLIILAVGELEIGQLLHMGGIEYRVFDHICGFAGTADVSKFEDCFQVKHVLAGHYRKCLLVEDSAIFTARPVISDLVMQKKMSEINYGLTTKEIICQLVSAGSINKLNEAIFNRFGLLLASNRSASIHYQMTVPVELNHKEKVVQFSDINGRQASLIFQLEDRFGGLETHAEDNFYPGTHVRIDVDFDVPGNVIFPFLEPSFVLSPFHHSFQKLVTVYKRVRQFIGEGC